MRQVLLIVAEIAVLAVAQFGGGPPWTAVAAVALVIESVAGLTAAGVARLATALVWLVAFRLTGDRELFFPFCMHLAAHAGLGMAARDRRLGIVAASLVAVTFLGIRVVQRATGRVLAVEAVVTVAVLGGAFLVQRLNAASHPWVRDTALVIAVSLAAFAGLAL